ncbi:putative ribonuclease H-like domain-containing protein [Tanacetum coccineum]
MMSFLTVVVTSWEDKLLLLLEQRENTLLEQVEATQRNNRLSSVTTAKGRVIFLSSALCPREKGMKSDPKLPDTQTSQTVITHNAAYQADDLDAFMTLIEQIMTSSEQSNDVNQTETEITSDSNIIPYSHEHAYWKATSVPPLDPSPSSTTNKVEVPKELPKVSMVNTSLKELKRHLTGFDQTIEQHRLESRTFKVKMNQIFSENERLLAQTIDHDIVQTVVNLSVNDGSQSQEKDTVIVKLKEQIKSLKGNVDDGKVKIDMDEVETLNIELEHREQGLVIAALKNELRKLKGKALDKEAIETHSVDPNVSKDNVEPITPKLLNKRTAHSSYIKHTQEEALVLRDIVEHVKANYPQDSLLESAFRYTKVIQELLSNISRTCPSINNFDPQLVAVTPRKKDKKVRFAESLTSTENTKTDSTSNIVSNKHVLHSTGVRLTASATGSQPSGNTRNDKILQTPSSNSKNKVEAHSRNVKSSLNKRNGTVKVNGSASMQNSKKHDNSDYVCINGDDCMSSDNLITTTNEVPSRKSIVLQSESPKPVVNLVYSRKPKKNKNTESVSKTEVIKTNIAKQTGPCNPGDPSETYVPSILLMNAGCHKCPLLFGLRLLERAHDGRSLVVTNVLSVNSWMIQVRLKETVRRIRTDNGTEFVNQTLREYYEKADISHETSVARSPQQNGVVERRNRTLIEAACTMLIYAKAPLFLWAEVVATACYTQNRSMIRLRHGKTPYELLHDKPPDLSYLHVFGALCYPTNDSENLGKLQPKADIGIFISYAPMKKAFRIYNRHTRQIIETIHVDFDELTTMASEHSSSGPALYEMTPATISSGLDMLFQPLFDELINPPPSVDHPAPEVVAPIDEVAAPEPAISTGSPSSTIVDQDAPLSSNSQTTPNTQPPVIPNDVEEDNHDIEVAHMGNDSYFGIPILEVSSDQSSSSNSIHIIVHLDHQISKHNNKWTKDHPLENIIGELARLVSIRLQLHEQALFCYYNAFLTVVEPKTYKDALTQACWIEAMQEELNEFVIAV